MKNLLFALLFISSVPAFSQAPSDSTQSSQSHTDSSLNLLSKMKLTAIYLEQVEKLAMSLPYAPFTLDRSDSTGVQLDIPESKYLDQKRKRVLQTSDAYGEVIRKRMYEIVPYSDKRDIIAAILFLQKINSSL